MLTHFIKRSRFPLYLPTFGHRGQWQKVPTGGCCISSWNRWVLKCPLSAYAGGQLAAYQTGLGFAPASTNIHLLVDGDAHGIAEIKQGMSRLEKEGHKVQTSVFAPPGRESSPMWTRFLSEPGVTFCPVARATTYSTEPTDDAIVSVMRKRSRRASDKSSLALLTSDSGFVDPAADAQARGRSVIVLIPEGRLGVVKKYEAAGLQVIKLESNDAQPKVRAILHEDGTGSVQFAGAFDPSEHPSPFEVVETFLEEFGFKANTGNLITQCAKYWFENGSGSIPVYPPHLAVIAVHDGIQAAKSQPRRACFDHLAYFLPIASGGAKLSKENRETFGSGFARQVWSGGGPFMKQDSPTLVAEVLEQLGYINEGNADLKEPIFCFINNVANKKLLRRLGMLPTSGDATWEIVQKLRGAFLSNSSTGVWQVNNSGDFQSILQVLRKDRLLLKNHVGDCAREDIFAAMQAYARKEGLPLMHTFDALAIRIRHHNNANSTLRQLIEIE